MSFIAEYREEDVIDVDVISERKISTNTAMEDPITEVFSEKPQDTVQEKKPVNHRDLKIGDIVSMLFISKDGENLHAPDSVILDITRIPSSAAEFDVLYLVDTKTRIVVGTRPDAILNASGRPISILLAGENMPDLVAINHYNYGPGKLSKNWCIEKLWKKIRRAKSFYGKEALGK